MGKKISEMTPHELKAYKKYQQSDAYKKYRQSDAYKQSQKKYHQSDAYKKYRQSDAYKQSQKKYQQSDAFKQSQKKYQQSDAYKKYHQSDAYKQSRKKYHQSDAYKQLRNPIQDDLRRHYLKEKERLEKTMKQFMIPPIPLQGKLLSINNILSNIDKIEAHINTLNASRETKRNTMNAMLENLMEKEGMLVSKRKAITGEPQANEIMLV